jgi:phosphoribosylaminoimidazole-succinocarboxamide synthase
MFARRHAVLPAELIIAGFWKVELMGRVMLESRLEGIPVRRGKVRDVYDFGDRLLFVATDRISAFDHVLPCGVPGKGEVLTRLSRFWFSRLSVRNHNLTDDLSVLNLPRDTDVSAFAGRSMVVKKTQVIPIECVVRGYLAGSGWKEYRQSGTVCSQSLPSGLQECSRLPQPLFTPAYKADVGHDENISFERMCDLQGTQLSEQLRKLSLQIYAEGAAYAGQRGIIIADTKFEFGLDGDQITLIDEVMTPDSSRFWPAELYQPGVNPPSFDKQFVRDWLDQCGWDKNSPPPSLPDDVVSRTAEKYVEAFEKLTGQNF